MLRKRLLSHSSCSIFPVGLDHGNFVLSRWSTVSLHACCCGHRIHAENGYQLTLMYVNVPFHSSHAHGRGSYEILVTQTMPSVFYLKSFCEITITFLDSLLSDHTTIRYTNLDPGSRLPRSLCLRSLARRRMACMLTILRTF